MSLERPVVLAILGMPITTTVLATSAMVAVLSAVAFLAGRRIGEMPGRWQAVAEWGMGALVTLLAEMTGASGRRYVPLVATIAIFVLAANLMAAVPLVEAPTADVNTPVALALVVFFSVHYFGVRELGFRGYLRKFSQPLALFLPINVLGHLTRTLSLAIRLFGNMVSHQIIGAILLVILPLIVPAVLQMFGLFIGVLQAYIFTILTAVYIGGAVRATGEA
ncbi:MAG TPA: F0F1 ATP synthase subunit A [Candidatus Methylomirabilis sp.]|nr:F0F1 ATP synthase subunit A [Candidatus Methylomirabilis sp.]